ncbi:hypothetical protein BA953_00835 [Vibrio coralliilyticus]|uniref:DUF3540 domain-containing protein n=1 Tax=Vibrio coralliilyticus TaxID=190893 RepID=UPI000810CE48|nr:DUF3540 domain-containing protein [Vibrio coralliilyticus]ANW25626.1 hypothetical protein BA953_00835 [Vibrio coralliilyticus]
MVVPKLKVSNKEQTAGVLFSGVISAQTGSLLAIIANGRQFNVKKASGCLLVPEIGDLVMAVILDGQGWVIEVLEKYDLEKSNISVPGALNLHTEKDLTLSSSTKLEFQSPQDTAFITGCLSVNSNTTQIQSARVDVTAEHAEVGISVVRQIVQRAETYTEHLFSKLGRCVRSVKGHDEQHSGSHRHIVEGSHVVESENSLQVAHKHMAFDADKIHFG